MTNDQFLEADLAADIAAVVADHDVRQTLTNEMVINEALAYFMTALNDHIAARIRYERDGPRYAGENEPRQTNIERAFKIAVGNIAEVSCARLREPRTV
jgi:hypothetical protein